jgi:hypothetical protein
VSERTAVVAGRTASPVTANERVVIEIRNFFGHTVSLPSRTSDERST